MSLSPGSRLGSYDVTALIGSGGMGEVYRARDTKLGRDLFANDPERLWPGSNVKPDAVFALLGQERVGKPGRLRWAVSMKKSFGVDPLLDREGSETMRWARRLPPTPSH